MSHPAQHTEPLLTLITKWVALQRWTAAHKVARPRAIHHWFGQTTPMESRGINSAFWHGMAVQPTPYCEGEQSEKCSHKGETIHHGRGQSERLWSDSCSATVNPSTASGQIFGQCARAVPRTTFRRPILRRPAAATCDGYPGRICPAGSPTRPLRHRRRPRGGGCWCAKNAGHQSHSRSCVSSAMRGAAPVGCDFPRRRVDK
jgi:hypothetical protein